MTAPTTATPPATSTGSGSSRRSGSCRGRSWSGLGAALREAEEPGSEHPSAILAIRLLALTGARRDEILCLRWREVDFKRALIDIDSKTGRKRIPLPAPALERLSKALRLRGNPYVCFGAHRGKRLVGLQRPWERIRSAAGLDDVRLHDLRHSHAAMGAGLRRPVRIPWPALMRQFGSREQTVRNFRLEMRRGLEVVRVFYPELRFEVVREGLWLWPGASHVRRPPRL